MIFSIVKILSECKNFCKRWYNELCCNSIVKVLHKAWWKFCSECEVSFKITLIKSIWCPCCHNKFRDKPRDKSSRKTQYELRKLYHQKHPEAKQTYKERIREYCHINMAKKMLIKQDFYYCHRNIQELLVHV
jgi:hypothetical protein